MTQQTKPDKEVVELLAALGKAYLDNNENEKAVEKFRQLFKLGVDDPDVMCQCALALARNDVTDGEALEAYKKAVDGNETNEALYLTLATLFLKENITDEPALKVFRTALKFSPPFADQLHDALEKIFQETTETIAVPEVRETLLDCVDHPELLSLYLNAAWREAKYEETLHLLKDLYIHSDKHRIFLEAICKTLLEKKAGYEKTGRKFKLTPSEAQHCLNYYDVEQPLKKIQQIETYLDFKNLFLSFPKGPSSDSPGVDEYEILLSDEGLNNLGEISENQNVNVDVDNTFDLVMSFIKRFAKGVVGDNANFVNHFNTLTLFEITNFDPEMEDAQLPVNTFLKLMANKLNRKSGTTLCRTEDGMIALSTNAEEAARNAIGTLRKLNSYNEVVDAAEVIHLKITVHSSPIAFRDLEKQGLQELRKGVKVHNLTAVRNIYPKESGTSQILLLTDSVDVDFGEIELKSLGQFKLPHFPEQQNIQALVYKNELDGPMGLPHRLEFGKYESLEKIKEDWFYATHRGYDPQLERQVIIKAYKAQAFTGFKEFNMLRKQFYDEIRKLNKIIHPNVAVIYDAGEMTDILYFVRELIEGKTLNEYLGGKDEDDFQKIVQLFLEICKVLRAYHANDVWHKNLKPSNVMVTPQNEVKLLDGGLLQIKRSDRDHEEQVDAQVYSAPEQINGATLTPSCDIFQLGVMLYEAITGEYPFKASTPADVRIKVLSEDPFPPSEVRDTLPTAINDIVMTALAKNPEQRYQRMEDFESDLKELAHGKEKKQFFSKVEEMIQ